jgi:transposase
MEAYPLLVRKRIIELYEQNKSTREIAEMFGICRSGTRRIKQNLRERGTIAPRPRNAGRKPKLTPEVAQQIRDYVAADPDCTREELKNALNLMVSLQAISKWLKKLGLVLKKKSLHAKEQDRPDVKAARELWHDHLKDVPIEKLVFLDESGAQTNMTRTRGRAPRGVRVIEKVPHGHWLTTTMISAIRTSGPFAEAIVTGATDSDVFRAYVKDVLAPQLQRGDVVIMDNLQPHKAAGVKEMIEAAGARLLYLPPYSPDYNPIENMWSKVKQHLRSAAARTYDALLKAIADALATITVSDCVGFFRHCGYDAI